MRNLCIILISLFALAAFILPVTARAGSLFQYVVVTVPASSTWDSISNGYPSGIDGYSVLLLDDTTLTFRWDDECLTSYENTTVLTTLAPSSGPHSGDPCVHFRFINAQAFDVDVALIGPEATPTPGLPTETPTPTNTPTLTPTPTATPLPGEDCADYFPVDPDTSVVLDGNLNGYFIELMSGASVGYEVFITGDSFTGALESVSDTYYVEVDTLSIVFDDTSSFVIRVCLTPPPVPTVTPTPDPQIVLLQAVADRQVIVINYMFYAVPVIVAVLVLILARVRMR